MILLFLCRSALSLDASLESAYGVSLFNQGKYEEAKEILEKALQEGKATPIDMAVLGMCYTRLKDFEKAQIILEKARKKLPFNSFIHLALGALAFEQEKFEKAFTHFDLAERLDLGSRQAKEGMTACLLNRGIILFQENKPGEARKLFQEALTINPEAMPALRNLGVLELTNGDPGLAAEYFRRALKYAAADVELIGLFITARKKEGSETGLINAYERLINIQPSNPEPRAALGILLEKRGKKGEAEQAFLKAEELGTEEPYPYFRLAELFSSRDETDRALHLVYQAIGKAIQKSGLIKMEAVSRIQEKEGDLGAADYEALKELSGLMDEPLEILRASINLLKELHRDNDGLEEDLRLLSSWYPSSGELQTALGSLLQEEKRWEEALALWQKLLRKHPTMVEAHLGMALSLRLLGRAEEACLSYLRALDLAPKNPEIYTSLESLYLALGKEDELLSALLERSLRDRRNPLLFKTLARIEERLGKLEDAEKHRARAKKLEIER